jgi:hypothetical protein
VDASTNGGELPPPSRSADGDARPIPLARPGDALPSLPRTPAEPPRAIERRADPTDLRGVGRLPSAKARRPVWYLVGALVVAAACVGAWLGFRELIYGDEPAAPPATVAP